MDRLIWNLCLGGNTAIQHVLKAHYRAITDINWHTTECDVVCSIGIDSWIWTWDIRTARKPIFGALSPLLHIAFGLNIARSFSFQRWSIYNLGFHVLKQLLAGGTQVKWNYKDGNLLASAHADEVFIWDRRVSL